MITKEQQIQIAKQIGIVSGVFTVLLCILLLINYWNISRIDPIESEALKVLVERLEEEPNSDHLKKEIRQLDLLARKAYFTSKWQIKRGGFLLLIFGIICITSLRFYYSLSSSIEIPDNKKENEFLSRIRTQRWIFISAGIIFIASLATSFFSQSKLEMYNSGDHLTQTEADINENNEIEVIEVVIAQNDDQNQDKTISNDSVVEMDEVQQTQLEEPSVEEIKAIPVSTNVYTKQDIYKNHNTFRGPFGLGISTKKNIPVTWDGASGKNIKWKAAIAKSGYNSPVFWGNKIFVAGGDNSARMVFCYDKQSGKLLWERKVENIPGSPSTPPRTTDDTGLSAPTVATDGSKVFAIFGTGNIIAFDMNGNRIWAKNVGVPDNHYGHSSSLICWGNKVFIQFDSNKGGRLLALHTDTGNVIWENKRNSRISWASPILVEYKGKFQLILASDPAVAGYDIETGKELWRNDCLMGEIGPSPAYADGIVYGANEYATLAAIDIETSEIIWELDEYLPEVASPVVANGLLFIATSYAVFVCYDAKTGEKYWEFEDGEGFYSSPMVADGKVYISEMGGTTYIFELSKEMKLIGQPKIGEKLYSTMAFDDGKLFLRSNKNLYCISQ